MSGQLKLRHGTATDTATFTGARDLTANGGTEVTIDRTNNRVVVHDGATAGGFPAAKLSEVITSTGFGAQMLAWFNSLPTTLPATSGVLWNNGGTLAQS